LAKAVIADVVVEDPTTTVYGPPAIVADFKRWCAAPWLSSFDFGRQNNRHINGMLPLDIGDEQLIQPLYNYITLNMQTSYCSNGLDQRPLRLAHCHRLAHRYLELKKLDGRVLIDTAFKSRVMFTIQRSADNAENDFLYQYVDPNAHFSRAWLWKFARYFAVMIVGVILLVNALDLFYVAVAALRSLDRTYSLVLIGSNLLFVILEGLQIGFHWFVTNVVMTLT
jgi:hypothetical protein